jgi:hypothetical protein
MVFFDDHHLTAAPRASPAYRAAALSVSLACAVAATSNRIRRDQASCLEQLVREEQGLTASESLRFAAHVQQTQLDPPSLYSLQSALEALTPAQREQARQFLVKVVVGEKEGVPVKPRLAAALARAHKLLGPETPPPQVGSALSASTAPAGVLAAAAVRPSSCHQAYARGITLACAVLGVYGPVPESPLSRIRAQLAQEVGLTDLERQELTALLWQLSVEPPQLSGLQGTFRGLTPAERQETGDFLIEVIRERLGQIDGAVEVTFFGALDSLEVPRRLLSFREAHGFRRGAAPPAAAVPETPVSLDAAKVAALQQEQGRISALLDPLFQDLTNPETRTNAVQAPQAQEIPALLGLDPGASAFLRALLRQRRWAGTELAALARAHGLPLDGVLERLNEACYERLDVPLFEQGEPLILNPEALAKDELQAGR